MSPQKSTYAWLIEKARQDPDYPLAIIAYFGPDEQLALRVDVGIVKSVRSRTFQEHKTWTSAGTDVRADTRITQEIIEFIHKKDVHRVMMTEEVIGCHHEEGIDYNEGDTCPYCSYWAVRAN